MAIYCNAAVFAETAFLSSSVSSLHASGSKMAGTGYCQLLSLVIRNSPPTAPKMSYTHSRHSIPAGLKWQLLIERHSRELFFGALARGPQKKHKFVFMSLSTVVFAFIPLYRLSWHFLRLLLNENSPNM